MRLIAVENNKITTANVLLFLSHLRQQIFTSNSESLWFLFVARNSVVFVGEAQKYFLPSDLGYLIATALVLKNNRAYNLSMTFLSANTILFL